MRVGGALENMDWQVHTTGRLKPCTGKTTIPNDCIDTVLDGYEYS